MTTWVILTFLSREAPTFAINPAMHPTITNIYCVHFTNLPY